MKDIFKEKFNKIFAIELGLSADTYLADMISELENKTFVTNSDAHSLPKIAREYNKMMVEDISFKEVVKALKNEDNRKVLSLQVERRNRVYGKNKDYKKRSS